MKIFPCLLLVLVMAVSGCESKKTEEEKIQALIDAEVAQRVEDFRQKRMAECSERIMERANRLADSIVLTRAISTTIIDTLDRPLPPDRPLRPPIIQPKDTTPVIPFFRPDTLE